MIPPLAVVFARMGSTRFPGKMMHPLNGKPLFWYAWRRAVEAFGEGAVVVSIPASEENDVLREYCAGLSATVHTWEGDESDCLGRLYYAAHLFRWHPDSVIARVTADDPLKDPQLMRMVAMGARHPVELSCECVTLQELNILNEQVKDPALREHLTHILSPVPPPTPPEGVWTVDTPEDLEAIGRQIKEVA